ncbi:MAG: serine/threonine protein kinase [Planctomycetes bacterium]|nr:serine/threonine protein kinase [Planctomycetota bacterium]
MKTLAPRLSSDADFVRRFQAEARAAAALNHPNVVTVYDVGEQKGVHYLSMEYMDKGTLEDRIARGGRIPWQEVLDIARDAALGLAFAESRRIVHRDLKPANLMQNSAGQTKIADLGLATHVEAEEREAADKKVFGTLHFMSPEQARGERVDGRSDLYSLGATIYRLLTGHTAFDGASAKEIGRAHVQEEPRPLRDFAADVPEGVVAMVAKLMQKDPAARFQSAQDLVRELERLKSGAAAAGAARPRASAERKGSRGLVVLVLLAALGGAGYWYFTGEGRGTLDELRGLAGDLAKKATSNSGEPRPADGDGAREPNVPDARDPAPPSEASAVRPPDEPRRPTEDDAAEQEAEAKARTALQELAQRELPRGARRDELRALAGRYRGTTAATEAWQQAEELAAAILRDEQSAAQAGAARDDLVTRMRAVAALDKEPPEPGKALLALRALDGQQAFSADPQYAEAKKSIEREIMDNATRYADRVLLQCEQLVAKGDFDGAQKRLEALMPVFELPDFPLGEGPAGVDRLFNVGRTARERLNTMELSRVRFVEQKQQEDTRQIAVTFGGPEGLEHELRALDLRAARARLAAVEPGLTTEDSKQYVRTLATDLAAAQGALEMLAREFPNWRRKGFTDPREKKGATRNAVGADAAGLLCEGEGGKVEHVDWSAFGGNARDLARLFTERLAREYTTDEARGIAALLRVSAVVEAIDLASKMLDPTRKVNFTETNARELLEAFVPATTWAQKAPDAVATALELSAATQLAGVLQRVTDGAYSVAVAETEELLANHQASLLVRLLSDGNLQLAAPAVPPAPENGAGGAAPVAPAAPRDEKPKEGGR